MSAMAPNFSRQQELANKKVSQLNDKEKIYLLKREIDNLRGSDVNVNGGSSLQAPSDSSSATTPQYQSGSIICQTGLCRVPMLTVFLALGVLLVVRLKRRQLFSFPRRSPAAAAAAATTAEETTLQFEMQDAHYDYKAPSAAETQFF